MFSKISQMLDACKFWMSATLRISCIGVFLWACKIFESNFFTEHFWTTASVDSHRGLTLVPFNFAWLSDAHFEPSQTSKMKRFARIVDGWKLLTIFAKKFQLRCLKASWIHFWLFFVFWLKFWAVGKNIRRISTSNTKPTWQTYC